MGQWIVENDRGILHLSNTTFQILYDDLNIVAKKDNVNDHIVNEFIHEMDQDTYGVVYLDIKKFDNYPESLLIFIGLIKKANEIIMNSGKYRTDYPEIMNKFSQELESYYDKIKKN